MLVFMDEYAKDFNATGAAVRAGYSPRAARSMASQLMAKPEIQAQIAKRQAERSKNIEIDIDWVKKRYAMIARADIRNAYNPDGSLKPIHELDDDTAAALTGIETETRDGETITKKLKRVDPTKALDALGRHLGFFPSQAAPQVTLNWAGLLDAVAAKLAPTDPKLIDNDPEPDKVE